MKKVVINNRGEAIKVDDQVWFYPGGHEPYTVKGFQPQLYPNSIKVIYALISDNTNNGVYSCNVDDLTPVAYLKSDNFESLLHKMKDKRDAVLNNIDELSITDLCDYIYDLKSLVDKAE